MRAGRTVPQRAFEQLAKTRASASAKGLPSGPSAAGNPLRVLQFNVLADGLAQNGSFVKVPPGVLEWSYRAPLLLEEVVSAKPDVICLQEVNHYDDFFKPQLARAGYEGTFLPKSKSPAERYGYAADGCCIFYHTDRLSISGEIRGEYYTDAQGAVLSQGYIVCPLRDLATGSSVLIATTHLKAKKGQENEELRILQARQMTNTLQQLTREYTLGNEAARAPHLIVAGDFNTTEESEVCGVLRSLDLTSIWDEEGAEGPTCSDENFTTWKFRDIGGGSTSEVKHVIDYIWYSRHLCPTKRWSQLTEDQIGASGLPSATYPSDHIAICCDLIEEW